jgi:hypothetical protein
MARKHEKIEFRREEFSKKKKDSHSGRPISERLMDISRSPERRHEYEDRSRNRNDFYSNNREFTYYNRDRVREKGNYFTGWKYPFPKRNFPRPVPYHEFSPRPRPVRPHEVITHAV